MLHTIRITLMAACVLILASSLFVGCGGEECVRNADCQKEDKTMVCKLDLDSGKRSCVKPTVKQPSCPATCDTDTDCVDCEDGLTSCVNRFCSKAASECPSSCSGDTDCAKCEDGKTTCSEGACIKKATCPETCSSNDECSDCADGNTACVSGTCDKPSVCPAACAKDDECKDCPSDRQKCTNGTCGEEKVCPSTCAKSEECKDCAAGNTFCNSGACGQPPNACPTSCVADVDCTNCEFGLNSCTNGRCSPKENKCPAGCTTDTECKDCADNKTACLTGVCQKPLCPSSCAVGDDCKNCPNRTACLNKKCSATSCPSSCGSDAECATGCGTKTKCIAGSCEDPASFCGPCAVDNDCSQAGCSTKTKCVAGQCQDGNTCPSFCRTDAECSSPGCAGKNTCINNKCLSNTCPSSCANTSDCLSPGCGNRTNCTSGQCTATPQCPASCTSSTQCTAALCGTATTCTGGTCQGGGSSCPPLCFTDSECSACGTGYTCRLVGFFGTCAQGAPTCPSSCTTSAQCAPCGSGYTCQSGSCSQGTPTSPAGRTCSTTSTCPTGYRCITITDQSKSYCFQDCTTATTTCASNSADGRTNCTAFATDSNGASISVCLGEATNGQSCALNTSKQAICKRAQSPTLYCSTANTCKQVVVQGTVGAACNKPSDTTEPIRTCDETKGLACSPTTGKCVTATLAKEGEHCDPSGTNLGKQTICDTSAHKDILCVRFSNINSACHVVCDPKKTGQCGHKPGTSCWEAFSDGRGLCMDMACSPSGTGADCVFPKYRCTTLQAGGNACFPKDPPGPIAYGKVCKEPVSTNGCVSTEQCLMLQNATSGFCTHTCTSTCPTMGGKTARCVTAGSSKYCLVSCFSNASCPTGLVCTSLGIGDYCFPP